MPRMGPDGELILPEEYIIKWQFHTPEYSK